MGGNTQGYNDMLIYTEMGGRAPNWKRDKKFDHYTEMGGSTLVRYIDILHQEKVNVHEMGGGTQAYYYPTHHGQASLPHVPPNV